MQQLRGHVLHCSRFGCVVRLEDGRFGLLPASERGIDAVKRALDAGGHPNFPFAISEQHGRRVRLALSNVAGDKVVNAAGDGQVAADAPEQTPRRFSSSLEQKIIDFWRQVSDWDRNAGRVDNDETPHKQTERLLPFEERAPRQYREIPKRSRKGPKPNRRNLNH